jgi:hypothetical protein
MGYNTIRVKEQFYLKSSDANEKEAVKKIEKLMADAV